MLAGLRDARVRAGLTQREAAELCRTTFSRYVEWEKGRQNPSADKAELAARELGCTLDELVLGFDEPDRDRDPNRESKQTVTREEFDALRKAVDSIASGNVERRRPSCLTPAASLTSRLGIADRNGTPVTVGSWIRSDRTGSVHRVTRISFYESEDRPGEAVVNLWCGIRSDFGKGSGETAYVVDGVMRGFTVVEFAEPKAAAR